VLSLSNINFKGGFMKLFLAVHLDPLIIVTIIAEDELMAKCDIMDNYREEIEDWRLSEIDLATKGCVEVMYVQL